MKLIIYSSHLFPCLLTKIETKITIVIVLTKITAFMLSGGVGSVWENFRVRRKTQRDNVMILEWIKFRNKSDKNFKTKTKQNTYKRSSQYYPIYHTGRKKGQEKMIGSNINKMRLKVLQENID